MPTDPLIDRYKATLQGPHQLRGGGTEPVIPINPSLLATVSNDIQYYGKQYKLPAKTVGIPGYPYKSQRDVAREGAAEPAFKKGMPGVTRVPPSPDDALTEGLKLYALQPSTYMLSLLLFELSLVWKLYEQLVTDEYAELLANDVTRRTVVEEFNSLKEQGSGDKGGEALYRKLRPVYYRGGIREPQKFLIKNIVDNHIKLNGREVLQGVHKDFAKLLARAEQILTTSHHELKVSRATDLGIEPLGYIGCFSPRDLAPDKNSAGLRRLSNHMIGAAVDIGSGTNPHLKPPHVAAIDAILAFRVKTGHPALGVTAAGSWLAALPSNATKKDRALALFAAIQAISKEVRDFVDENLPLYLAQRTPGTPLEQEALKLVTALGDSFKGDVKPRKLAKGQKPTIEDTSQVVAMRSIVQRGFVSIPAEVFVACLEAGLMSGDQYEGQKDTMHFEIPFQGAFIKMSL